MKTLLGLALASVIIIPAQAAMRAPSLVGDAPIIRVEGGCGPYEFRSPDGFCRRKEESRRELRHEGVVKNAAAKPGGRSGARNTGNGVADNVRRE
jgi:hypothetical protein